MINVNVVGRLGNDPKLETLEKGGQFYTFSIATDDFKNGKSETIWCRVIVFNQALFNKVSKLKKGGMILLHGSCRPSAYIDKKTNEAVGQIDINAYNIDYVNTGRSSDDSSSKTSETSKQAMMSNDEAAMSCEGKLTPDMMERAMANSNAMPSVSNDDSDDLPF